jgi:hypothetical protein
MTTPKNIPAGLSDRTGARGRFGGHKAVAARLMRAMVSGVDDCPVLLTTVVAMRKLRKS